MPRVAAGWRVRRMGAADLDRVMEIAHGLEAAPHWPRSAFAAALDPDSTLRRIALVAEAVAAKDASGLPVSGVDGFAVVSLLHPQAELETIAVASAAQRRGVARLLFAAMAGELRASGVAELFLEVRASNQAARALYRSLGFVETGRRTRYYIDPIEDAILMALDIGRPVARKRGAGEGESPGN
jgi:ribosomal-protein-alanine N-acetyltransferase